MTWLTIVEKISNPLAVPKTCLLYQILSQKKLFRPKIMDKEVDKNFDG